MPSVVVLFGVTVATLLVIFQYITVVANLTNEIIYRQVAFSAARAALDYGKDKYDGDEFFDVIGPELDAITGAVLDDQNANSVADNLEEKKLFENNTYRVTYQLKMVPSATPLSDRSKRVQGIGRVYLPKNATTPRYSRVINSEIISSVITAENPSDFSPLAWYDASCNPPHADPDCQFSTVLKEGTDSAAGNPTSLREEKALDGLYCGGAPNTGDGNLAMPVIGECGNSSQNVGMVFNLGSKLPKGVVIEDARIQFTADKKGNSDVEFDIAGLVSDNFPNFTANDTGEIHNAIKTTARVQWKTPSWQAGESKAVKQRTPNLKGIVQEIIDRPGWAQGNNIAFRFKRVSSTGERYAKPTPMTLTITYSGYVQANQGERVKVWRDRSGNGFHMIALNDDARPTRKSIIMETADPAQPMVEFTPSQGMKATVPASTGRKANTYTAVALMRMKPGTEKTEGHGAMVSFYGEGTGWLRYSPFWRHPSVAGFHPWDHPFYASSDGGFFCNAMNTFERSCMETFMNHTNNPWAIYSAREGIVERDELLRRNGKNNTWGQANYVTTQLNAPYTMAIGADATYLIPRSDIEVAELILYDRALTCSQLEGVEKYLVDKWKYNSFAHTWNETDTTYKSSGCAENTVPAY
ncbi:hypothetical protein CYG49_05020 [Candidatus Saccharibacteria bacterium]|nr:MAG: hypothetical protein CYG49_05020 [Candidatus Saccharibacteria bacterium]